MAELVRVKLIERISRTPTVESFRLSPQKKVDFLPGQFLQVIFDESNPGNKELNKYLSFSCAPGKPYIEFTKRLSASGFSQKLRGLKAGDELLLKAPMGACVFKDSDKKIAFLIGGIGITPVISIIEYINDRKLATDVCLLYSNRNEDEIAFKKELDGWKAANKINISYLVSECEPKDKTCYFGVINADVVKERICELHTRLMFIFGPPKMVEAMKALSLELGLSENNIRTESFVGY